MLSSTAKHREHRTEGEEGRLHGQDDMYERLRGIDVGATGPDATRWTVIGSVYLAMAWSVLPKAGGALEQTSASRSAAPFSHTETPFHLQSASLQENFPRGLVPGCRTETSQLVHAYSALSSASGLSGRLDGHGNRASSWSHQP
jgi:hypothetical protein